MKTEKEIITDFWQHLRSLLCAAVGSENAGLCYREGYKTRSLTPNTTKDLEVIHTAGNINGDIQTGIITIKIYIPDIHDGQSGRYIEDGVNAEKAEKACRDWFDTLHAKMPLYSLSLYDTISTEPVTPDTRMHMVVMQIKYKTLG